MSAPHRRARVVECTKQAEGAVGVTGALFRRGAESDDPGAIVEAARFDSASNCVSGCLGDEPD